MELTAAGVTSPVAPTGVEPAATPSSWHDVAACAGTDVAVFFGPVDGDPRTTAFNERRAKQICATCTVRTQCLELALEVEEDGARYGIFGGLTPDERDRLLDEQ